MKSSRTAIRNLLVVVVALLVAASCVPPSASKQGEAESTGPLKVGVLVPLTGPLAGPGEDHRDGFLLWLKQHKNRLGGRPVDVIVEDSRGNPDAGIQAAKRLVERRKVDFVVGPLLGNVGLAVGDYMAQVETPLFYAIPSSEVFLRERPETTFLAGGTAAQDAHPMGTYAAKKGYRKVLTICSDYAFGRELCGGFANTFTDAGGTVTKQLWPPLGTADFGPFISQLAGKDYDAIYTGVVGADSIKFVDAYRRFGLDDKTPLLSSLQPMDETLVPAMGENALGLVSSGHWAEGRDSEQTRKFVEAYEKAFKKIPGYYSASGYLAGQWIDAALRASSGKVGSAEEFLDTLADVELGDTIFGPIKLDERRNVVWNVYLREVTKRDDGKTWNTVTETLANTGPTYTYTYDAYVEQPTYSRGYQGADWPRKCSAFAEKCPLGSK